MPPAAARSGGRGANARRLLRSGCARGRGGSRCRTFQAHRMAYYGAWSEIAGGVGLRAGQSCNPSCRVCNREGALCGVSMWMQCCNAV
eukprot:2011744-Prymnesium_polylepis.1